MALLHISAQALVYPTDGSLHVFTNVTDHQGAPVDDLRHVDFQCSERQGDFTQPPTSPYDTYHQVSLKQVQCQKYGNGTYGVYWTRQDGSLPSNEWMVFSVQRHQITITYGPSPKDIRIEIGPVIDQGSVVLKPMTQAQFDADT